MENGKRQGERGGQRTDLAAGDGKLGPLAPGQRWTVARKREVVLRLLRGESAEMLSRELGVEIYRLERWRDKALSGIDAVLRERDGDPVQAELDAALKRIGELTMENELLWAKTGKPGPLPPRGRGGERDDLRDHWSPLWLGACLPGLGTGAVVVLRPAAALKKRASANEAGTGPLLTDEELLGHIRTDLAASPFSGEGHRKVWARLRVQRGVRVARKRVLRLMRAHNLLSWRRCRQGVGNPHQGEIVTRALSQPPRDIPSSPQRSQ